MSIFRDSNGIEWRVSLDAFTLDDIRKETGVDLADLSAGGWAKIETDAGAVVRVLAVICRDEITARKCDSRQFAKGMRGTAIESGRAALLSEGADFFPPSEWSVILSNCAKRRDMRANTEQLDVLGIDQAAKILPLAEAFLRLDAMTQSKLIDEATSSDSSPAGPSAGGPENIPSSAATDGPASAE